jgi:hypothetical protein
VEAPHDVLRDPDAQAALAAQVRATVQETLDRNAAGKPLARLSAVVEGVEDAARALRGGPPAGAKRAAHRRAPPPARVSARPGRPRDQYTERSSISKTRVAFGGISGGAPRAP